MRLFLNGKVIKIGDKVATYTVENISANQIILSMVRISVTIKMKKAGG